MRTNTKKGYYTVEAAIFLPIFIIAVLTIGCYLKVICAGEIVTHAATDELRYTAAHACEKAGPGDLGTRLTERISKENGDVSYVYINDLRYKTSMNGISDLITCSIDHSVDIRLPLKFTDDFKKNTKVVCRAFTGARDDTGPMSFASMEHDYDSRTVYVFPHSGEHYHKKSCTYVSSKPVQTTLSSAARKKYKACSLCHPGSLSDGSQVYCFLKYGSTYHRGSCSCVDKYYIPMERSEAESRGYIPCSKCGGV